MKLGQSCSYLNKIKRRNVNNNMCLQQLKDTCSVVNIDTNLVRQLAVATVISVLSKKKFTKSERTSTQHLK